MTDRLLLIPGLGAVDFKFTSGGRPSSYNSELLEGEITGDDATAAELSCAHPDAAAKPWGPLRTSLSPRGDLAPGSVLDSLAYAAVPARYRRLPYDWRLDLRYNGQLLLEYLKRNIHWQGGDRWRIVAHCQGGLLLLNASRLCQTPDEFSRYVSRMVLVACPLVGTLNAMAAVIDGSVLGPKASPLLRKASRTWPAMTQMFPQFACVAGMPAMRATSKPLWSGEANGFMSLLGRGKDFSQWYAAGPFQHLQGPLDWRLVFSRSTVPNTRVELRVDSAAGTLFGTRYVLGDTLVPYEETIKYVHDHGLHGRSDVVTGSSVPDHLRLLSDPRVWDICAGFLEN